MSTAKYVDAVSSLLMESAGQVMTPDEFMEKAKSMVPKHLFHSIFKLAQTKAVSELKGKEYTITLLKKLLGLETTHEDEDVDRMSNRMLLDIVDHVSRKMLTRNYRNVWGYINPAVSIRGVAHMFLQRAYHLPKNDEDHAMRMITLAATGIAARTDTPVFYVSSEFYKDAIATDLPKGEDIAETPWPHEAMMFVMPPECVAMSGGRETRVTALTVIRVEPGRHVSPDVYPLPHATEEAIKRLDVETELKLAPMVLDDVPADGFMVFISFEGSNLHVASHFMPKTQFGSMEVRKHNNITDQTGFCYLAMQLILIMHACPELIEPSFISRAGGIKRHKKRVDELWSPNFIGRNYRSSGSDSEGSGGSVRMHWRRGHLRRQRYGQGRLQIKTIWIKKMFINASHE
jgi:hypothetical protein